MAAESAYIDTSVLGAYYCPEPQSEAAERALRQVEVPVISNLSEVEFHSLIARKYRLKELSESRARAIIDLFGNHVSEGFYRRMALGNEHFIKARQFLGLMSSSLHTLDALHLAAAYSETIPVMTADQVLLNAAKRHRIAAVLVR